MAPTMNRKQVEVEIKNMFGFVPGFYNALPDAAVGAAWQLQENLDLSDTLLDHKTKQLIGLAVAAHIKCRYCIYFHTRGAEAAGATPQELREAVAIGGATVFFSNALTGAQTDYDAFKRDTDRAIEHLGGMMKR